MERLRIVSVFVLTVILVLSGNSSSTRNAEASSPGYETTRAIHTSERPVHWGFDEEGGPAGRAELHFHLHMHFVVEEDYNHL